MELIPVVTLVLIFTLIILSAFILYKQNKPVLSKGVDNFKVCGDKYVIAQNKCLDGRPNVTAVCSENNKWAKKAQKCIDSVDKECRQNCRLEDCPAYLQTPYDYGCDGNC